MIVTVTGGARSGKSAFAEKWCMKQGESGLYIATAQAYDTEMRQRIAHHRLQREESGFEWSTLEEPLRVAELLEGAARQRELIPATAQPRAEALAPVVLIDCLTLWLSNVMLMPDDGDENADGMAGDHAVQKEMDRLVAAVANYTGKLVMVTNEVGSGIVPEYPLGRKYRDWAGILNRKMAEISDQVFLVTAGIAIELKSREYKL